jgi:hypothetical protein
MSAIPSWFIGIRPMKWKSLPGLQASPSQRKIAEKRVFDFVSQPT